MKKFYQSIFILINLVLGLSIGVDVFATKCEQELAFSFKQIRVPYTETIDCTSPWQKIIACGDYSQPFIYRQSQNCFVFAVSNEPGWLRVFGDSIDNEFERASKVNIQDGLSGYVTGAPYPLVWNPQTKQMEHIKDCDKQFSVLNEQLGKKQVGAYTLVDCPISGGGGIISPPVSQDKVVISAPNKVKIGEEIKYKVSVSLAKQRAITVTIPLPKYTGFVSTKPAVEIKNSLATWPTSANGSFEVTVKVNEDEVKNLQEFKDGKLEIKNSAYIIDNETKVKLNSNTVITKIESLGQFKVSGQVTDAHSRPLKRVAVSFWWDENGSLRNEKYKKLADGYADENGNYELQFNRPVDKDGKSNGYVRVDLRDKDNIFRIINWERGMDTTDKIEALDRFIAGYSAWSYFGKDGFYSYILLPEKDNKLTLNIDFNQTIGTNIEIEMTKSDAHIYVNTLIAADFYKQLGVGFSRPFDIYTFVNTYSPDVYFFTEEIYADKLHVLKVYGPYIILNIENSKAAASSNNNTYKYRQNAEWHEFSHYVMWLLEPSVFSRNCVDEVSKLYSQNHWGFLNGCTVDSYKEGFAEFMGQVIYNKTFSQTKAFDSKYRDALDPSNAIDLDWNYIVNRIGRDNLDTRQSEEQSVAGLLWDLYDGKNAADNDNIEMDISSIWRVLTTKDVWPVYYDVRGNWIYPRGQNEIRMSAYISDLYDVLVRNLPDQKEIVNKLFVTARNIFWDKVGTINNFEPGDIPGIASPMGPPGPTWTKAREFRQNFQFSTSSVIVIKSPKEALPYDALVSVKVSPPNDYLSFEIIVPIIQEEQSVYVAMPPSPPYESTYMITAKKENYKTQEIFKVSSADYWKSTGPLETQAPILEKLKFTEQKKSMQNSIWFYVIIILVVITFGILIYIFLIQKKPLVG